jgi:Xaa-Pro aminopeptidase
MKATNAHCRQFQKQLTRLKVDGYWVFHIPDLFYLTGYGAEGCWGLFGKRRAAMLVPMLAVDQAAALAKGFEILPLKKLSEVYGMVVDYAVKAGWKRIGYDPYHTSEAYILGLRKASGRKLTWVAAPGATTPLRIKKDSKELKALRGAGHVVIQGFNYIKRIARPGMRECDLAAEFESYIRKHGASKTSFDSIVAAGENAAYPHYITGDKILRKNDMVLCDIGALVDGYCSDLTRTFFLGTITPLSRRVYETVARAQKLAIQAVKPGVKAAQIDRIARDEIERAGYGRRFIHSTGHGVGVEIHEAPWVSAASQDVLEAGMIITVEPGIYLPGWGGVRIEDTLLVTRTGYEILTK